jgi:hypothetical protein
MIDGLLKISDQRFERTPDTIGTKSLKKGICGIKYLHLTRWRRNILD